MGRLVYTFSLLAAAALSVALGNHGVAFPAVLLVAFYFAMRFGMRRVIIGAITASAFLDALWLHETPQCCAGVLIVCAIASIWRRSSDVTSLSTAIGGGVLCVCANFASALLDAILRNTASFETTRLLLRHAILPAFAAIVVFPLMAAALNAILRRRLMLQHNAIGGVDDMCEEEDESGY